MNSRNESAFAQINRLGDVIAYEIPGEPSRSEGAVDTAIRLLRAAYTNHRPIAGWLTGNGRALAAEVDRLWPHENDPGYRGQCLAEEAGEVNRAITKRRHATHSQNGICKGMTVDDWTANLRLELAQALGVILDIAYREGIDLVPAVEECVTVLQQRPADT